MPPHGSTGGRFSRLRRLLGRRAPRAAAQGPTSSHAAVPPRLTGETTWIYRCLRSRGWLLPGLRAQRQGNGPCCSSPVRPPCWPSPWASTSPSWSSPPTRARPACARSRRPSRTASLAYLKQGSSQLDRAHHRAGCGDRVSFTSTTIKKADGTEALSFAQSVRLPHDRLRPGLPHVRPRRLHRVTMATRGNVRTTAAPATGSLPAALTVAFRTGGVAGMFTARSRPPRGDADHHLSSRTLRWRSSSGSSFRRFTPRPTSSRVEAARVFTKAADVGADLRRARSRPGSPRTTRATRRVHRRQVASTSRLRRHGRRLFESLQVASSPPGHIGVAALSSWAEPGVGSSSHCRPRDA